MKTYLQKLLDEFDLSQSWLAKKSGISQQAISNYCNDKVDLSQMTLETMYRIVEAFNEYQLNNNMKFTSSSTFIQHCVFRKCIYKDS